MVFKRVPAHIEHIFVVSNFIVCLLCFVGSSPSLIHFHTDTPILFGIWSFQTKLSLRCITNLYARRAENKPFFLWCIGENKPGSGKGRGCCCWCPCPLRASRPASPLPWLPVPRLKKKTILQSNPRGRWGRSEVGLTCGSHMLDPCQRWITLPCRITGWARALLDQWWDPKQVYRPKNKKKNECLGPRCTVAQI